jgi:hypothetical protein
MTISAHRHAGLLIVLDLFVFNAPPRSRLSFAAGALDWLATAPSVSDELACVATYPQIAVLRLAFYRN